jgi:hypothetical protein
MFGARCSVELSNDITHVVAGKVCASYLLVSFTATTKAMAISAGRLKLMQRGSAVGS